MPVDFLTYDFMKNAFIAILILTPLFGLLGTMVVGDKLAYFSDALGHSALCGMVPSHCLSISYSSSDSGKRFKRSQYR